MTHQSTMPRDGAIGRRQLLAGIAGSAATFSGAFARADDTLAGGGYDPTKPIALRELEPKELLNALYSGNRRFVEGRARDPNRDFDRIRELEPGQEPAAAFLSCADSRVPVEILFDQGFGDLFVTRVAGNVATPESIAGIEFAVVELGVKVVYVLGHTRCGAVAAAAKGEEVPGQISALFQYVLPAIRQSPENADEAVRANVLHQVRTLEASPVISAAVAEDEVLVTGGIYELGTGRVRSVRIED